MGWVVRHKKPEIKEDKKNIDEVIEISVEDETSKKKGVQVKKNLKNK